MADSRITDLVPYLSPQNLDVLPIVDVATLETKKVSFADFKTALDIPIFLDETSTIADFQTGRTHYYVGEAATTYDYDAIPYPLPVPITNFNFVNLSPFDVLFTSDGGNYGYNLAPDQALQDITITDGGGFWEIQ